MNKRISLYLKDIEKAIQSIEEFIDDLDFEQFKADDKTTSAVIKNLRSLERLQSKFPTIIKKIYSQIPWKNIKSPGNYVISLLSLEWKSMNKKINFK